MVWSLSKDDDGLDSVLPLADGSSPTGRDDSSPNAAASLHGSRSLPAPGAPTFGSPAAGGASSVLVDPTSQVPEAPHAAPQRRRGVEPTQILKGRRLDALRAEVAERRRAHRRKQQRNLLLWGLAGGGALCLGWLAGQAFNGSSEESEAPSPVDAIVEEGTGPTTTPPAASADGTRPTVEDAPPRDAEPEAVERPAAGAVELEDLPGDDDEAAARDKTSPPSDDGAISLEDLPAE